MIATLPATATSFLDTGLTPGDSYSYYVSAGNTVGSTASNTTSATTPVPPLAVSDLQPADITTTGAVLSWSLNSSNDSGVQVWREVDGAGSPFPLNLALVTTLPAGSTSYLDSGLQPGTIYEYEVYAIDLAGSSAVAETGLTTLPTAPVATATSQSAEVQLSWAACAGAVAYNVYRGLTPGGEGTSPYATVIRGATSFTDTGVTVGETYYYEVTAVDFSGEGAPSAEVSLVATDSGPQVVGVYVSGSAWSTAKPLTDLFGALAAAGAGNTLGYELATGAGQLSDANIPGWVNLDTISLVFSEPVSGVSASSLSLGDSSNNGGPSSGITVASENNPSSTVATFTLSGPLTSNKYFLDLAAAGITDAAGTPLDGAWTQGVSTFAAGSGDGSPASDFVYRFDVLAGDVIGDGTVSAADVNVERSQPLSLTDTSTNWRYDINGAGEVSAADVNIIRSQPLAAIAAFPDPDLPGGSGGPVAPGALGSSGGITVTSGTLIVTDPSEMPAGTHLAVGAGASLLFGPSAGSTSPAATAGPSAIASPIASAAASALPAATTEVGGPRSEAGGLTSDLRLPTSEPGPPSYAIYGGPSAAITVASGNTPAAERISGDLAWWLVQDQHPKKGAAIPALDAAFAHYGP